MEILLDRRLNLIAEPEHKSLYAWAIQETDEDGNAIGLDQVTWRWTLTFTAISYTVTNTLNVAKEATDEMPLEKSKPSETRSIKILLRPGSPTDTRKYQQPTYSMFGTSRSIQDFELVLHRNKENKEKERCTASGYVSYVHSGDFQKTAMNDYLGFDLHLKPAAFDYIESLASSESLTGAVLSVGHVSGFYSQWSPMVVTDNIKVLENPFFQKLEIPPNLTSSVHSLGQVGQASLFVYKHVDLMNGQTELITEHESEVEEETDIEPDREALIEAAVVQQGQTHKEMISTVKDIRNLVWVLLGALSLIVVERALQLFSASALS